VQISGGLGPRLSLNYLGDGQFIHLEPDRSDQVFQ